jgi:DNA-binding transcriptional ArsR family regulator
MNTQNKQQMTYDRASIFSLLADPTRLNILDVLNSNKEICVSDIADELNISLSATSHQLGKLELLGVVEKCRYGTTICYCLNKKKLLTKKILKFIKLSK